MHLYIHISINIHISIDIHISITSWLPSGRHVTLAWQCTVQTGTHARTAERGICAHMPDRHARICARMRTKAFTCARVHARTLIHARRHACMHGTGQSEESARASATWGGIGRVFSNAMGSSLARTTSEQQANLLNLQRPPPDIMSTARVRTCRYSTTTVSARAFQLCAAHA